MLLYVWRPRGHGQLSFFVVAASLAEAKAAIDAHVDHTYRAHDGTLAYEARGWNTDYYEGFSYSVGTVVEHPNE